MTILQITLAMTAAAIMAGCGGKSDDANRDEMAAGRDTAAPGTSTGTSPAPPMPPPPTIDNPMSDAAIFDKMAKTDSLEIELARIALTKTKNADVKEFANMMVTEHGRMRSEGAALAARLGIIPAPREGEATSAGGGVMMQQMQTLTNSDEFDRFYVNHMVISHQETLEFLGRAAGTTKNDSLRAFLEKGRPVVQMHLQHAQDLMGKVGAVSR